MSLSSLLRHQYTKQCGEASSPHVGIRVGIVVGMNVGNFVGRRLGKQKPCRAAANCWLLRQGQMDFRLGNASGLYQMQLFCAFNGFPPAVDVELTVDALGVRADGAERDYEMISNLRPRKLGVEQAQNFKLTLA